MMPEIGEKLKLELLGDYIISGEVLHDVKVLPWSPHKYALPEMDQGSDRREGFPCPRQCCFRHYGFREPSAISRPQINFYL